MAQLGLDPEQMTQLSKAMKSEADSIDASAKKVDGKLRSVWWKGKDSDSFKSRWEGQHRKAMNDAARLLRRGRPAHRQAGQRPATGLRQLSRR